MIMLLLLSHKHKLFIFIKNNIIQKKNKAFSQGLKAKS